MNAISCGHDHKNDLEAGMMALNLFVEENLDMVLMEKFEGQK